VGEKTTGEVAVAIDKTGLHRKRSFVALRAAAARRRWYQYVFSEPMLLALPGDNSPGDNSHCSKSSWIVNGWFNVNSDSGKISQIDSDHQHTCVD